MVIININIQCISAGDFVLGNEHKIMMIRVRVERATRALCAPSFHIYNYQPWTGARASFESRNRMKTFFDFATQYNVYCDSFA